MRIAKCNVYSFDELYNESKKHTINKHIEFLIHTTRPEKIPPNMQKAVERSEKADDPLVSAKLYL